LSIRTVCSQCSSVHSVHDRFVGREIRCPNCNHLIQVPEKTSPSVKRASTRDKTQDHQDQGIEVEEAELVQVDTPNRSTRFGSSTLSQESHGPAQESVKKLDSHDDLAALSPEGESDNIPEEEFIAFPKKELPKDDMDMTPMVDVTFLLLIFFMITASFSSEKVLEEPPPLAESGISSNPDPQLVSDSVKVQIDEFNGYTVIFPAGDEREASSKQDLLLVLGEAYAEASTGSKEDQLKLLVEAHVESIHAAIVAALDAGRSRGFTSFQVQVVEEF
jgi:biopolymer transport protein ExbD